MTFKKLPSKPDGKLRYRLSCGIEVELADPTIEHLELISELEETNGVKAMLASLEVLGFTPPVRTLPAAMFGEVGDILRELFPNSSQDNPGPTV